MRGRVWLVLAALTGAGSLYVNDHMERADDRRALRAAIEAVGKVTPRFVPRATGGGPVEAAPPTPATAEYAVGMTTAPLPVEEEPPVVEFVVERAALADAAPPVVADVSIVTAEVAPIIVLPVVTEPPPKVASVDDAGILYDPNVPYVFPIFVAPNVSYGVAPSITTGPLGSTPAGIGGAGGMVTPSVTMAGGTAVGFAGAAPVIGSPFLMPAAPPVLSPFGIYAPWPTVGP